jgi:DNA recombination protein RmuC
METALIVLAAVNLLLLLVVLLLLKGSRKEKVDSLLRESQERTESRLHAVTAQQTDALARVREEVRGQIAEGMDRIGQRLSTSTESMHQKVGDSLAKGREEQAASLEQATRNLEQRFGELRQATEQKLVEIRGEVEKKLGETVAANIKHFDSVAQRLKDVHEATGQIVTLSKGVHDLNVLLQTPKARGAFGELTLEQMLNDLFGEHTGLFELQFTVDGGERVDAAIFLKPDRSQILCVDSKFPLANAQPLLDGEADEARRKELEKAFRNDVLSRAAEISGKYIRPPRTAEFAFMFVPAESVYFLLLRNADLHQRLLRMHVIPTSPNSFYAYLQALSIAFRGMKIEEKTREIQKAIAQIGGDFERFADDYRVLGKHLEGAYKRYGDSQKRIEKFQTRVRGITHAEMEAEEPSAPQLEGPEEEPPGIEEQE